MKPALILTYSIGYLPAMNALLCALDYYGHEGLDVHVLYHASLSGVLETYSKAKFSFTLKFTPVEPLFRLEHDTYINLMFCKYRYAQQIGCHYDAICHLDGDVLLLTSLMPYLKIAAATQMIPCATFPHTHVDLSYFKSKDHSPDWVACFMPMANFPVFYDPARHMDFIRYCWDNMPLPTNTDRERNNEMYIFNRGIFETNKVDDFLPLPGNFWVGDRLLYSGAYALTSDGGRLRLVAPDGDRFCVIHNKFWKEGVANGELQRVLADGGKNYDQTVHNIGCINNATHFFNTEGKVKLADVPLPDGVRFDPNPIFQRIGK